MGLLSLCAQVLLLPPWHPHLHALPSYFQVQPGLEAFPLLGCPSLCLFFRDPNWATLRAMDFHYLTQPLPSGFARAAHFQPRALSTAACAGMFVVEIIVPFLFFGGAWCRAIAFLTQVGLQVCHKLPDMPTAAVVRPACSISWPRPTPRSVHLIPRMPTAPYVQPMAHAQAIGFSGTVHGCFFFWHVLRTHTPNPLGQ